MKLHVTKLLILSKFRLLFLSCSKFSDQLCTKKLNNPIDIKAAAIPYIAEILYHSIRTFFAILDSTYSTYSAKPTMQISFCAKFFCGPTQRIIGPYLKCLACSLISTSLFSFLWLNSVRTK